MLLEIESGVIFLLKHIIIGLRKYYNIQIIEPYLYEILQYKFIKMLENKYKNHWYPNEPSRGK